jgi:hypothetical protein
MFSISSVMIGLLRLFVSTGINLGKLYYSRNLSILFKFQKYFCIELRKTAPYIFILDFLCFDGYSHPSMASISNFGYVYFLTLIFLTSLISGLYILLIIPALG